MSDRAEQFKLLVVDDNATNLSLMAQIIEMDLPEVRVYPVHSAAEALTLMATVDIDGAFVDVQMPEVDGLELCRRMRADQRSRQILVVLMTAHIATAELRAQGLEAGAYDFISQPISNLEMLARIKVMLRLRRQEKELAVENRELHQQVEEKASMLRWLQGLMLASGDEAMLSRDAMPSAVTQGAVSQGIELFAEMPQEWGRTLLKLALLEEIPPPLAERLSEIADIREALSYLWRHNFFADQTADGCYRFEDKLHQRLRAGAEESLTVAERDTVTLMAVDWYRDRGQMTVALGYLLRAQLYPKAELFLSQQGVALTFGRDAQAVAEMLSRVPEEVLLKRSWLALFSGMCRDFSQSEKTLEWLELSRVRFASDGDELGELMTLIPLVLHCLLVDGRYALVAPLVPRLKELLEKLHDDLDTITVARGYEALALSGIYGGEPHEQSEHRVRVGLELALNTESAEIQAELRLVRAYLALLRGRFERVSADLEACLRLTKGMTPSPHHRAFQQILHCQLLFYSGDFDNCHWQAEFLDQRFTSEDLRQTPLGGLLSQCQIGCFLAGGERRAAQDLLSLRLGEAPAVVNPHLRSLLLHYQALLHDSDGREMLQEAVTLRALAGGAPFMINSCTVAAVFHLESEDYRQAEALLDEALRLSMAQDERLSRGGIYARRAELFLKRDRQAEAVNSLRLLLELLERKRLDTFFLLTPELLRILLPLAMRHSLLPAVVGRLANRHLQADILADGTLQPVLQIKTLGSAEIYLGEELLFECSELSSIARQLIAILITAPRHQIGIEFLLAQLWPDSAPDKARANLDGHLSRLRKQLDAALGEFKSRDYLVMEKGILSLQHTRVDSQLFTSLVREGQKQIRRQNLWQAGLAFRTAQRLWGGVFLPGQDLLDEAIYMRQNLTELRLEMIECWSRMLMEDDPADELGALLRDGQHLDPTRETLIQKYYQYALGKEDPHLPRRVLNEYRQALLDEDYGDAEADEFIRMLEAEHAK
ncbi:MAG: hypothetical protein C0618_08170 [Desulfuromonas sp.]|nr:MAG: hypothetical protein C0618_08170 [Desulfuromonas sp.]